MKKGRILLLSGNYHPEPTGIGKYNGEMIDWLLEKGFQCGIVTTYPYYPFWEVQEPYVNKAKWYSTENRSVGDDVTVNIYRCPHYVPRNPTGKKRIISDLSFFISAFFRLIFLIFQKRYDYVITVAPPFQLGLLGLLYGKLRGAKVVYHIQDLQVDAAYELGMIKNKLIVKVMFSVERMILRKADFVSSISDGMIRKIKGKYNREVIMFPNWTDISSFYPMPNIDEIKREFSFLPHENIVLYSGAIGEKQGLESLLHSAKTLSIHKDIKFVICGSGHYKEKLISYANDMNLGNIMFMPIQPKEKFNKFLNMADLHLVLQKSNANDLVMPSKLTTILSVGGLVLVTAEAQTSLHEVIAKHQMGLLVEPECEEQLTSAILKALREPHSVFKRNAREYAENHLNIDAVLFRYFSEIKAL